MSRSGKSKGGWYTMEVFIVIFITLTSFIMFFNKSRQEPDFSQTLMKHEGFWVLQYLDSTGLLRIYSERNDTISLYNKISELLPNSINYDISICDENYCTSVNLPQNETIILSSYYIYGWKEMKPMEIKLYMWSE